MESLPTFAIRMGEKITAYKLVVSTTETTIASTKQQQKNPWIATYVSVEEKGQNQCR
jgi:hypothetical protein